MCHRLAQARWTECQVEQSYMRLSMKVMEIEARSKSESSVVYPYSVIFWVKGMLIPQQVLKEMTTERVSQY